MDALDTRIQSPVGGLRVAAATVDHAPAVRELRNDLARWMLQRRIEQWTPGEMSLEWIETCISLGAVHVITLDEQLVGSVTVVWADPFVWAEPAEPAGYVHMLMVDRRFCGHGIGRSILAWAESSICDSGRQIARLDCARTNRRLRAYYEDVGYRFVEHKGFPGIEGAGETALYEKSLVLGA
jgi:GNAT superfamily N-acetyltransferase